MAGTQLQLEGPHMRASGLRKFGNVGVLSQREQKRGGVKGGDVAAVGPLYAASWRDQEASRNPGTRLNCSSGCPMAFLSRRERYSRF